jgi:hypothetical protein
MRHIKQNTEGVYTMVEASEPLEDHLSIIEHPELFEIVDNDLPEYYQTLTYQSDITN